MESTNDLFNADSKFEMNGFECCTPGAMVSYDTATTAFLTAGGTYGPFGTLFYTSKSFTPVQRYNYYMEDYYTGPIALTKNYIYVADNNWSGDSLIISRTAIKTDSFRYFKFIADSGTGKFLFVNDSTGFLLTYHRGHPKTNVLIKTSDYGVTWSDIYYDSTANIVDYCFPSKDTGYIINSKNIRYAQIRCIVCMYPQLGAEPDGRGIFESAGRNNIQRGKRRN